MCSVPWINDAMVVNHIEFRDPAHNEKLRFGALYVLIGNHIFMDANITEVVGTKKQMRDWRGRCGDIWSLKDSQRLKSTGVAGGSSNRAKPLEQLLRDINQGFSGATICLPGPNETKPKIEAIRELKLKLNDFHKKARHLVVLISKSAPDANKQKLEQLQADVNRANMQMNNLDRGTASGGTGGGPGQNGGDPPELTSVEILAPDHVLRQYGALGGAILADFNDEGVATLDRVQLSPGVGTMEAGTFALRFVVVTPLDLSPLMRDSTDDALRLQIPDIFPRQLSGQ
jgi:hypothetical protein